MFLVVSRRLTVDGRHGNMDNAVEVDIETGVLKKTPRPGMGTIMARERVGKTPAQHVVQYVAQYCPVL